MEIQTGYCQCGCGGKTNLYRGKPRRFLLTHQNRFVPQSRRLKMSEARKAYFKRIAKPLPPIAYCACGCGQITSVYRGVRREVIKNHVSPRIKELLRLKNLGKKMSPEACRKMSEANKGKFWSEERKAYYSQLFKGEKAPNWQGGISDAHKRIRRSHAMRKWRKAILEKNNYICVFCGEDNPELLQADHIKSFSKYPELRFEINNGRTLCISCHMLTDNYGGKSRIKEVVYGL